MRFKIGDQVCGYTVTDDFFHYGTIVGIDNVDQAYMVRCFLAGFETENVWWCDGTDVFSLFIGPLTELETLCGL